MAELDEALERADRRDRLGLLVVDARDLGRERAGVALEREDEGRAADLLVHDEAVRRLCADDARRRRLDADLHVGDLGALLGREAREGREEVALEEHVDRVGVLGHRGRVGAGRVREVDREGDVGHVGRMGRDEGELVVGRLAARRGGEGSSLVRSSSGSGLTLFTAQSKATLLL